MIIEAYLNRTISLVNGHATIKLLSKLNPTTTLYLNRTDKKSVVITKYPTEFTWIEYINCKRAASYDTPFCKRMPTSR